MINLEDHINALYWACFKFAPTRSKEEMLGPAAVCVLRYLPSYDPLKGQNPNSYVIMLARYGILRYFNREMWSPLRYSSGYFWSEWGFEAQMEKAAAREYRNSTQREDYFEEMLGIFREVWVDLRRTCSRRDLVCFSLYHAYGWTLQRIGSVYGLSRERVRQLKDRVMGKLQRRLGSCTPDFDCWAAT